jgi:hypothetical protein
MEGYALTQIPSWNIDYDLSTCLRPWRSLPGYIDRRGDWQWDNPGAPFATLDEAREHADWLEMVVEFQQQRREFDLAGEVPALIAGAANSGTARSVACRDQQVVMQNTQEKSVSYE